VHIRFLIALAAILLSALPSAAQTNGGWSGLFFPTTNAPLRVSTTNGIIFASDVIVSQMFYAVNERYVALSGNKFYGFDAFTNQSSFYYRKPDEALSLIKAGLNELIRSGRFIKSYNTNNFDPSTIVYYEDVDSFDVGLVPSDYFDDEPPSPDDGSIPDPPSLIKRNLMGNSVVSPENAKYGWNTAYTILNSLTKTFEEGNFLTYEIIQECNFSAGPFSDFFNGVQILDTPEFRGGYFIQDFFERWGGALGFDGVGSIEIQNIERYNKTEPRGKLTFKTIPIAMIAEYPYLFSNTFSEAFIKVEAAIDVEPGQFVSPGDSVLCPPQYNFSYANQDVIEQYQALCATNAPWKFESNIRPDDIFVFGNVVYAIPAAFSFSQPLRCSAKSIISDLKCTLDFGDFESAKIRNCNGDDALSSGGGYKSASSSASTRYVNIINWGFEYK
jgi:hypothetical protein